MRSLTIIKAIASDIIFCRGSVLLKREGTTTEGNWLKVDWLEPALEVEDPEYTLDMLTDAFSVRECTSVARLATKTNLANTHLQMSNEV